MTTISYDQDFENEPLTNSDTQTECTQGVSKAKHSVSSLLRLLGACTVVASLSLFLIEGWKDGNDLSRYIKLLAQTVLISSAGIFLSAVVKDAKGARVFFGLGLVSTVANFTILGALVYSIIQFDGALGNYPSMLRWEAINPASLLPLAFGALLMMALLTRFSFGIFARTEASRLTRYFLGLNALLLIPVREPEYVSILAAVALLTATKVTLNVIKQKEQVLTGEAKWALVCLFIPGIIVVTRALGLYAVDDLVLLTLSAVMYYALRSIGLMSQGLLKTASAWGQYFSGFMVSIYISSLVPSQLDEFCLIVFSISLLCITFDQCALKRLHNHDLAKVFISITTAAITLSSITNTFLNSVFMTSIGVLLMNLCVMVVLFVCIKILSKWIPKLRGNQILSLLGIVLIGSVVAFELFAMFDVGSWVILSVLGISLIMSASLYDRVGGLFKLPKRTV